MHMTTPCRSDRAFLILTGTLCLLALTACTTARMLRVGENAAVRNDEGLVALSVDSDGLFSLTLCKDGEFTHCVDLGPIAKDSPPAVGLVPAGQYCIMRLTCEVTGSAAFLHELTRETTECFDVPPGVITYPGHLVYELRAEERAFDAVRLGWNRRNDAMRGLIDANYPSLRETPLGSPEGAAAEDGGPD